MLYYQVKPEHDNKMQLNSRGKYAGFYIGNELYTPKEVEKHHLNRDYLKPVEVSRKSVYWFFGARFSSLLNGSNLKGVTTWV